MDVKRKKVTWIILLDYLENIKNRHLMKYKRLYKIIFNCAHPYDHSSNLHKILILYTKMTI